MKWYSFLFLFFVITGSAQTLKYDSDEIDGTQILMYNSADKYVLPLKDGGFVYTSGKLFSRDGSLVRLNGSLKAEWNIPKNEDYLFTAKLGNNIVMFSVPGRKEGDYTIKSIHASLVNIVSGKIILEKNIPGINDKTFTDLELHTDSSGNFQYLTLRATGQDKVNKLSSFKNEELFGHTESFGVITLDENLNVKNTLLLNAESSKNSIYMGVVCNHAGDVFIASLTGNILTVNKYDAGSSDISATVSTKANFENDVAVESGPYVKISGNEIVLAAKMNEFKKSHFTILAARFDFSNNKGYIKQEFIDKDYLEQYEAKAAFMNITGIDMYQDKLLVVKEILRFTTSGISNTTITIRGPLIVSVYNNSMKQVKEFQVNEYFQTFFDVGISSSYHILDNHLYVFYNRSGKNLVMETRYHLFDLDKLSKITEGLIDKHVKGIDPLYGPGIVWHGKSAAFPYLNQPNMLAPKNMNTIFARVDFE